MIGSAVSQPHPQPPPRTAAAAAAGGLLAADHPPGRLTVLLTDDGLQAFGTHGPPQSRIVDISCKKKCDQQQPFSRAGRTVARICARSATSAESLDVERVVHPSAFAPVDDQAGLLEHPKMEGEPGLRGIERIGELADAALAPAGGGRGWRAGSRPTRRGRAGRRGRYPGRSRRLGAFTTVAGHGMYYINQLLICQELGPTRLQPGPADALPRWLTSSFSSGVASPKVLPSSSLRK